MAGTTRTAQLRELLHTPQFRRLYTTRVVSATADGVFQAALASYVLFNPEKATTPGEAAAALAAILLPYSVAGPFMGVFLDRWLRQRVLVVGNLVKVGLVTVVAALVMSNSEGVGFFLATVAALGTNRLFLSALSAALPHVVQERQLLTANALTTTSGSVATVVGAAVGGVLRLAAGSSGAALGGVVLFAALVYAASAGIATTMPARLLGPDADERARVVSLRRAIADVSTDLGRAAAHVVHRRKATYALGAISLQRFCYGVATLTIVLLERNYFTTAATKGILGFGAIIGATGAGILVAALVTPRATRRFGRDSWITVLLIGAGLAILAFGLPFQRGLIVLGAFALGVSAQGVKICVDTTVQEQIDDAFRGRVFSVYDMLFNTTYVAAAAVTAVLLPTSGKSVPVMTALAVGYLAVGAAFGWLSRPRARSAAGSGPGSGHGLDRFRTKITTDRAVAETAATPKSSSLGPE